MLTPDMRAIIRSAHLCFAATVSPHGQPNLSPKGTIGVWDENRLFFLDLASPGTRANLAQNPWIELNVVDQLSRRGYRFAGRATLYFAGTDEFADAVRRVYGDGHAAAAPSAVVIVTVDRAAPLLSPAYWRDADETAIRARWHELRALLDREFEAYLGEVGPVRLDSSLQ